MDIFDCAGLLCGRILWLLFPRDPEGALSKDKKNPNPALRGPPAPRPDDPVEPAPDRARPLERRRLLNPDDGKTYNVSAQLKSADVLVARIYSGFPLFGRTKTLTRVSHGTSDGWC